jgi:hypothetical protein
VEVDVRVRVPVAVGMFTVGLIMMGGGVGESVKITGGGAGESVDAGETMRVADILPSARDNEKIPRIRHRDAAAITIPNNARHKFFMIGFPKATPLRPA